MGQLAGDLAAIDATTLRQFDPSLVPAAIKQRLRRERRSAIALGSFTRAVIDVLRQA